MREPLPDYNHWIDKDRGQPQPLWDGIPVGTIRKNQYQTATKCMCDDPRPKEGKTGYRFNEETKQTECFGYCRKCGLPIK